MSGMLVKAANTIASLPGVSHVCNFVSESPLAQKCLKVAQPRIETAVTWTTSRSWRTWTLGCVGLLIALHVMSVFKKRPQQNP